jgi:PAS domain S-box-containing protein
MSNLVESGSSPWFESIVTAVKDKKKQIEYKRLGEILQTLGDNAWAHDFSSGKTWYSADFNIFIGYSNHDISARKADILWWQSIHPDDIYMIKDSDARYRNGEQDKHSLEYRITDAKGKMRWVLDRGVVVDRDDSGKPLVVAGTHIDMTPVKDLQEKLNEVERRRKKDIIDAVIRNLETDRKMIAEELHGNINQILAAARMMLEFMPEISEESVRYTEKVRQIIYTAVDEVNKIFNDINPDALHHVDMASLVRDLVERLNKDRHFKVDMHLDGDAGPDKQNYDSQLTIYRVIQDVLKRVFKYSKGDLVKLTLQFQVKQILLEIFTDDPRFNTSVVSTDLYMVNLANRCDHFGGSFTFEKVAAKGIFFRATVSA